MKIARIIISVLLVALVLGTAMTAFADEGKGNNKPPASSKVDKEKGKSQLENQLQKIKDIVKTRVIKGEVEAVTDNTVRVDDRDIIVTEATKIHIPTLGRTATLDDIEVGAEITGLVYEQDGKVYARQIVVIPGKPSIKHHVGSVVAYTNNSTGGSITIKDKKGEEFTFTIIAGQFKILPKGAEVKVGDWVTVISRRNPAQSTLIASGVVVHKSAPKPEPKPGLQSVSGNITALTSANITIGTTALTYNGSTLFVLRGVTSVQTGQEAIAFYVTQNTTRLAKRVLVGIDLPGVMQALRESSDETESD